MKRKLQAALLLATAMTMLTGSRSVSAAEETDKENFSIGISIYDFEDDFMRLYRTELVRYLTEELGFPAENILLEDANGDQEKQLEQISSFIDGQADVMILNLVRPSSAPLVTDMCSEAGIPSIYINRQPYGSESDRWASEELLAAYVGADARQSGIFQGEEITETENSGDINGDGKVSYIMIQGEPENIDTQYRSAYSVKVLERAGMDTEELLTESGGWNRERGQEITEKGLEQFGTELEVVFCNNDAMALGALDAIREAGRTVGRDIYLTGVDALPEAVECVAEGDLTGTVFNDYYSQSHKAAQAAVKFLTGEYVEPVTLVDYVKVTEENAGEVLEKIQ